MGLSTKQQVPGDHDQAAAGTSFDWPSKTTLQSAGTDERPELPKPPPSVRRQQQSELLKCPRCSSTNTKFCYYNNYNKSQPRHLCKSCKRHWTKGGTLRNVPIGGGRKTKRPKISNAVTTSVAAIDCPNFGNTGNQKSRIMSNNNIIYQALIGGPDHQKDPINTTELDQFSSLLSTNYFGISNYDHDESLNAFHDDDHYMIHGNNLIDSVEESTITSVDNIPPISCSSVPWPPAGPTNTDCWNWNEIDVLTSSDHLNISWDDDDDGSDVKP